MMSKIQKVILKDLKNRLSKRWFWILSLMGPLVFTIMITVPVGLNMKTASAKVIEVWQAPKGTLPIGELPKNENFNYMAAPADRDVNFLLAEFLSSKHDIFIVIPSDLEKEQVLIYPKTNLSPKIKKQIDSDLVSLLKLKHLKIVYNDEEIKKFSQTFSYKTIPLNTSGKNAAQMVIGLVAAIVIYYFTFSYSVQVMRNVMEEKTNRVVEVILVAMKPWELMFAKIVGGSILGLIQFSVWILLTASLVYPLYTHFELDKFSNQHIQETILHIQDVDQAWEMNYIVSSLSGISVASILPGIFLYFILGYLLYSAMFAAIGASVDQDAETQLFIMPVTAPLAISIVFIQFVAENPHHIWSKFLTIFPLTSPVIAPIKIVTGEMSSGEFITSCTAMLSAIVLVIYLSGKIFKAGILNYGSSVGWKEILNWAKN
jgi:ABC-2 type transport system permease protein